MNSIVGAGSAPVRSVGRVEAGTQRALGPVDLEVAQRPDRLSTAEHQLLTAQLDACLGDRQGLGGRHPRQPLEGEHQLQLGGELLPVEHHRPAVDGRAAPRAGRFIAALMRVGLEHGS